METEQVLVKKAIGGDIHAFETIVRHYQSKIYALCLRYMKQDSDAQDAAQESVIKIYSRMDSFTGRSALSTWIYTITKNTCLDMIRAKKQTVDVDTLPEAKYEGNDFDPEKKMLSNELKRELMAIINSLSDDARRVLVLRDIDGFSYEQIAKILQISEGTVKSRLSRARRAFKDLALKKKTVEVAAKVKSGIHTLFCIAISFIKSFF